MAFFIRTLGTFGLFLAALGRRYPVVTEALTSFEPPTHDRGMVGSRMARSSGEPGSAAPLESGFKRLGELLPTLSLLFAILFGLREPQQHRFLLPLVLGLLFYAAGDLLFSHWRRQSGKLLRRVGLAIVGLIALIVLSIVAWQSVTREFFVEPPAITSTHVSIGSPPMGQTVQITVITDPSTGVRFRWQILRGVGQLSGSGLQVSYTPGGAGEHDIRVTVSNSFGESSSTVIPINVLSP
jgi:hypothetical protein